VNQDDAFPQLLGGRRSTILSWDHARLISAAEQSIARLESLDVKVPPNSRIRVAIKDLNRVERFSVVLGHGDRTTERLVLESRRTITELFAVVAKLHVPDDAIKRRLQCMLGGVPVPIVGRHDPARDAQAEVFAGSMLFSAGFEVISGEPDLIIGRAGFKIPVAVKRMTSPANFAKRMREARDQIEAFGSPGYIVVTADQYLANEYEKDRGADLSSLHYRKVAELTDALKLDPTIDCVLGIIGISTSFRHNPNSQRDMIIGVHFHQRFVTWGTPDRLQKAEEGGAIISSNLLCSLEALFGDGSGAT